MNKLTKIIYESNLEKYPKNISSIMLPIEDELANHNLEIIDEMLDALNETKLSTQACISIIWTTFRIKDLISNWYDFRRRIHTEIYFRGENADRLMRGLF